MFRYLESICIKDGQVHNLDLHQDRVCQSLGLTLEDCPIKLKDSLPDIPEYGWYKWRIEYDLFGIVLSDLIDYEIKPIRSVKCTPIKFTYARKFKERTQIDQAYKLRGDRDDILMILDGLVTDTSYGNVAFFKEGKWFTPQKPLLQGVRLSSLLASKALIACPIRVDEISTYEVMTVFNALIDYRTHIIPISNIAL